MVTEAWAVLIDKKLWRVKYATQQAALAAIDNALLRDIQKRAGSSRDWKTKFTADLPLGLSPTIWTRAEKRPTKIGIRKIHLLLCSLEGQPRGLSVPLGRDAHRE